MLYYNNVEIPLIREWEGFLENRWRSKSVTELQEMYYFTASLTERYSVLPGSSHFCELLMANLYLLEPWNISESSSSFSQGCKFTLGLDITKPSQEVLRTFISSDIPFNIYKLLL